MFYFYPDPGPIVACTRPRPTTGTGNTATLITPQRPEREVARFAGICARRCHICARPDRAVHCFRLNRALRVYLSYTTNPCPRLRTPRSTYKPTVLVAP